MPLGDVVEAVGTAQEVPVAEGIVGRNAGADADAAAVASRTERSNRFLRKRLWMRITRETFTPEDDSCPAAVICPRAQTHRGHGESSLKSGYVKY